MSNITYRYSVLNRTSGKWEKFTGIFQTEEDAERWLIKHGPFFEDRGFKLKLSKYTSREEARHE